MSALFYVTNDILLLSIIIILIFMYRKAKDLNDEPFQFRRRSFIVFYSLLFVYVCTSFDISTAKGVEVLGTLPICTLSIVFTAFMMLASAYFGRNHYQNYFLWFVLLQFPVLMLVIHFITRYAGKYVRIYSMTDLLSSRSAEMRIIFMGRVFFLGMVILCFILMTCMLIDAYRYYLKQLNEHKEDRRREIMRHDEILNVVIYSGLMFVMMITYFVPLYTFHIVTNILMTCMLGRTYYVYSNFLRYTEDTSLKLTIFHRISHKIETLSEQECDNPIYHSNPTLEDVAEGLEVDRQDFSEYLSEGLNISFSAWLSDRKISHFAHQLVLTNRKISELALACGYANVTSLNRAFKTRYNMTPSEYRSSRGC